ncbi:MAG: HPr kinase/phosphorylase, partial [Mesorhizobium sp.]
MRAENIHGTALLIGECGVLITGPSGSGKTTLALTLLD